MNKAATEENNNTFTTGVMRFGGKIKSDQIIIIADTHIGSIYEKPYFLKYVYNYAVEHDITDVIHCGDLMQSNLDFVRKDYINTRSQLEHLFKIYPLHENITTHLLLGNHDYHFFNRLDGGIHRIKRVRKDFNVLGYKKAYMRWGKFIFDVYHPINDYILSGYFPKTNFYLIGHSHIYRIDKNKIYIPTLSMDIKKNNLHKEQYPGFMVATKDGNNDIIFDLFSFPESYNYTHDPSELKKMAKVHSKPSLQKKVLQLNSSYKIKS